MKELVPNVAEALENGGVFLTSLKDGIFRNRGSVSLFFVSNPIALLNLENIEM